ncbi:MarC family NAAT transporter [Andreprevotia chitinilytica]|uniref:MarC family NAAT transporter n=1 Tax=Andreprevotia chitinilytica TaxID=396808 RepID=UPI000A0328D6|nr:MarC family NAAT transporter [Andreprevotia chitinilytica]
MLPMLLEIFSTILATLTALLPICNPLFAVSVLPGLTANLSADERARQVKRACYYMAAILITFLLAGALIMDFFSISIPGLRIAGGLVVAYIGFTMLFPSDTGSLPDAAQEEAAHKRDISFTPLAMPSLSGPGSIAVVISLSSGVHGHTNGLPVLLGYLSVSIGIVITAWIAWLTLRASTRLYRFLGENGINAISRIMGFLLICVGVQFLINGVGDLLHDPAYMPKSTGQVEHPVA